jgi:glucan phosphoethanolaminetransferase (alkaline phosphatase superfamily)
MIVALLQILMGIPFGIFTHRLNLKAILVYFFCLIALITVVSVIFPERAIAAISSITLAEFVLAQFQYWTGVGIGIIISMLEKRTRKSPPPLLNKK